MITIVDLARELGVGVSTVSYILNDRWREQQISLKLARRVQRRAREMGYKPSLLARQFRTKKTNTIGVVLPDLVRPYNYALFKGIADVITSAGYMTLVGSSNLDEEKEADFLQQFIGRQAEGIILTPVRGRKSLPLIRSLLARNYPLVMVDTCKYGLKGDFVGTDNVTAAYRGVLSLIQKGHKVIGYLGQVAGLSATAERYAGYCKALSGAGLPVRRDYCRKVHGPDELFAATMALGRMKTPPTAIFIESLSYAAKTLHALNQLKSNIALMGFDRLAEESIPGAEGCSDLLVDQQVFMIEQPAEEMGRQGAQLLFRRLRDAGAPCRQQLLPAVMREIAERK